MKGVLVIADGLGGRPTDYHGQTCLQAAKKPNLDELARRGITGLLDPIKPGVCPGSDTAHLSIFGYDPYRDYPGRGVFEAVGIGLDVQPGDICFRTNFSTVDDTFVILDRRAGRIQEGQAQLEQALQDLRLTSDVPVQVFFKASTEHRGALVLRGPDLSADLTEADPQKVGERVQEVRATRDTPQARRTAMLLNELIRESHQILKHVPLNRQRQRQGKLPANILLPRGPSSVPHLKTLPELYGIQGSVIAGGALYIGIGILAGLEFKKAEGATGKLDSNLLNKVKLAVREIQSKDFVFVHMKGTDSAGHDHDAQAKIACIEKIDDAIGYLLKNLDWEQTHLVFTGDHCTPIVYGGHTAEPVPLVIAGPHVIADDVKAFDERSVMSGGLGRISGNVIPLLAGYNNWLKKFGT
jgi:2,3-bisphosphoglycerate-independent phosphoglycerate mutase